MRCDDCSGSRLHCDAQGGGSMADDGSEAYLETVKGMIACTLGSKTIPEGHLMDAVLAMIADKASKY